MTRKAASAAKEPEASISGPAADKATSAQLVKMEKIISDFDVAQRASILALDKKYFKECKRLTDVVNAKFLTASRELRPRIGLTTKTLDIIVRYVRAYKQWVRKADDNEFLLEHNSLQKFCMEDPVVNLDFPQCIGYDMQEMMFGNGLMECLENKRHEEMKKRFEYITLPGLLRYKAKDEVESSQTELVNSAILKIIGSSLQTDADVAAAISRMQVFLEPVLHHDLEFASPLFFDLSMLQYVFKNDDNYEGRTKEMADRFRTIANSSSETCKIFTAMGSGRKVIQALKNKVADQIRKETGWQRLSVLASEQTHTIRFPARPVADSGREAAAAGARLPTQHGVVDIVAMKLVVEFGAGDHVGVVVPPRLMLGKRAGHIFREDDDGEASGGVWRTSRRWVTGIALPAAARESPPSDLHRTSPFGERPAASGCRRPGGALAWRPAEGRVAARTCTAPGGEPRSVRRPGTGPGAVGLLLGVLQPRHATARGEPQTRVGRACPSTACHRRQPRTA